MYFSSNYYLVNFFSYVYKPLSISNSDSVGGYEYTSFGGFRRSHEIVSLASSLLTFASASPSLYSNYIFGYSNPFPFVLSRDAIIKLLLRTWVHYFSPKS